MARLIAFIVNCIRRIPFLRERLLGKTDGKSAKDDIDPNIYTLH